MLISYGSGNSGKVAGSTRCIRSFHCADAKRFVTNAVMTVSKASSVGLAPDLLQISPWPTDVRMRLLAFSPRPRESQEQTKNEEATEDEKTRCFAAVKGLNQRFQAMRIDML